jgi:hypothetical protein
MSAMKLSPRWHKLLLTLHVATAVSVLGTDLVLLVLGISSVRGADPQTIYPAAHLAATWLLAPLATLALGTGVLLGLLTQWGLLRYWWVTIKLALTAILTGVIYFVLVPRLGVAAGAATALAPRPFTDAERLPLVVAPAAGVTLLILIVALAIYKPPWRLRSPRTRGMSLVKGGGRGHPAHTTRFRTHGAATRIRVKSMTDKKSFADWVTDNAVAADSLDPRAPLDDLELLREVVGGAQERPRCQIGPFFDATSCVEEGTNRGRTARMHMDPEHPLGFEVRDLPQPPPAGGSIEAAFTTGARPWLSPTCAPPAPVSTTPGPSGGCGSRTFSWTFLLSSTPSTRLRTFPKPYAPHTSANPLHRDGTNQISAFPARQD